MTSSEIMDVDTDAGQLLPPDEYIKRLDALYKARAMISRGNPCIYTTMKKAPPAALSTTASPSPSVFIRTRSEGEKLSTIISNQELTSFMQGYMDVLRENMASTAPCAASDGSNITGGMKAKVKSKAKATSSAGTTASATSGFSATASQGSGQAKVIHKSRQRYREARRLRRQKAAAIKSSSSR